LTHKLVHIDENKLPRKESNSPVLNNTMLNRRAAVVYSPPNDITQGQRTEAPTISDILQKPMIFRYRESELDIPPIF
jgi:hypothetical protein